MTDIKRHITQLLTSSVTHEVDNNDIKSIENIAKSSTSNTRSISNHLQKFKNVNHQSQRLSINSNQLFFERPSVSASLVKQMKVTD